jgi:hypothetical protein
MHVLVPVNSYFDLLNFFSTRERPMHIAEMNKFWDSLSISEKHYYMTRKLS